MRMRGDNHEIKLEKREERRGESREGLIAIKRGERGRTR